MTHNPSKSFAIFGAGMTGLVAAKELLKLGHSVSVYEASDHVGGLASTFRNDSGFIYDNGPRFIFSTLAEKLGIDHLCQPVKYIEHMHIAKRDYVFPFGLMSNPRFSGSAGFAMLTRSLKKKPTNLGEFLNTYYGSYFSGTVLRPLIEKWCGHDCNDMSIDFASRLLPTSLSYILYQVLRKIRGGITEDYYKKGRYIVYPEGSNSQIFEALTKTKGLQLHLNSRLNKLTIHKGRIIDATVNHQSIRADEFISTIPIPHLLDACGHPPETQSLATLKYRGILILFIMLKKNSALQGLWTWFPERETPFYRISEFKNALPKLAPKDQTLIAVEFALNDNDSMWSQNAHRIYDGISIQLKELYGISNADILGFDLKHSRYAYPILKKETENIQRKMKHQSPFDNLYLAGRTGIFQYRMLEGCYESAVECVNFIQQKYSSSNTALKEELKRDSFGRPLIVHE